MEEKQIEKSAQKTQKAAAPNQRGRQTAMTCQMCGKEKSCQKCHGLLLCTACTTTISHIKNNPDVIRRAWEQFRPDSSLEPAEEIDFDRLVDVFDALKAIKEALKDRESGELTPYKEKEIIKILYRGS